MKIELITKLVYGTDLIYIKDEKLREVFSALTKKKTLDLIDLENFKKIGRFYSDLIKAMKGTKWFDKSDMMTDYFHTAYFLSINVGKYSSPYQFTGA